MGRFRRRFLFLGVFAIFLGGCLGSSSHFLHNLYMVISEPGQGLPQFWAVGYVDGLLYIKYDRDTGQALSQVPWMEEIQKADPYYWDGQAQIARNTEPVFKVNLATVQNRYNHSHGEPPVVRVTLRADPEGQETLLCQAYGFYPKEIDVTWWKDGVVWQQDTFTRGVTPNSDGSYHTTISIDIEPKKRGRFRCHVEHDGLLEPLDLAWEQPASNVGLILGILGGLLAAVILLGAGVIFYKRQQQGDGYNTTPTNDLGLENSSRGNV